MNRSRQSVPETPAQWRHVNIVEDFGDYRLTTGITDSLIGRQTCAAAKIPKAQELTLPEALEFGAKLETWLGLQEKRK